MHGAKVVDALSLGCTYTAELETVQLSVGASAVGQEAEQRPADGKKGRKGKKKGKTAAVQQADLTGSTSPKRAFIMDPSKGELQGLAAWHQGKPYAPVSCLLPLAGNSDVLIWFNPMSASAMVGNLVICTTHTVFTLLWVGHATMGWPCHGSIDDMCLYIMCCTCMSAAYLHTGRSQPALVDCRGSDTGGCKPGSSQGRLSVCQHW